MITAVNFPIKAIGKKKPEKNQGFNGIRTRDLRVAGALLLKPHIGSEVNLLSSYLPWGVKRCEVYEIIHFWTAVEDESEEWSSQ